MWIDCMQIRKILWMWIRIQIRIHSGSRAINHQIDFKPKVKKKKNQICVPKPYRLATLFRFRLEQYNFIRKKHQKFVGWTLLFPSFYRSGSTNPNESRSERIRIHITAKPYDLAKHSQISDKSIFGPTLSWNLHLTMIDKTYDLAEY